MSRPTAALTSAAAAPRTPSFARVPGGSRPVSPKLAPSLHLHGLPGPPPAVPRFSPRSSLAPLPSPDERWAFNGAACAPPQRLWR
jgi:hypothetical protein